MAYYTFSDSDKGQPVRAPVQGHFKPGAGSLAAWNIHGQNAHGQPYVTGSTALVAQLVIHVPARLNSKPAGFGLTTDGNYKTFHARGSKDYHAPPTK
jgi:hypothetical protein